MDSLQRICKSRIDNSRLVCMTNNFSTHYCKHCNSSFRIKIHEYETGDFFLVCPNCRGKHYRHFEGGVAIHCNIFDSVNENIIELKGV